MVKQSEDPVVGQQQADAVAELQQADLVATQTADPVVQPANPVAEQQEDPDVKQFVAFMRTALVPMLVTKSFILFFGIQYSRYPGEGYGWGLLISVSVTVGSFIVFVIRESRKGSP